MFPLFQELPMEIRLQIWAIASNQEPRTIDIWPGVNVYYEKITNEECYNLVYEVVLSDMSLPAILQTSRESREEALKHYNLEYQAKSPPAFDSFNVERGGYYINYAADILIPQGNWTSVSYWIFTKRVRGKLGRLAVDLSGKFSRFLVEKCYSATPPWGFEALTELILYISSESDIINLSPELTDFKKAFAERGGVRRALRFGELEAGDAMLGVAKSALSSYFDRIDNTRGALKQAPGDTDNHHQGKAAVDKKEALIGAIGRPRIRIMELDFGEPN